EQHRECDEDDGAGIIHDTPPYGLVRSKPPSLPAGTSSEERRGDQIQHQPAPPDGCGQCGARKRRGFGKLSQRRLVGVRPWSKMSNHKLTESRPHPTLPRQADPLGNPKTRLTFRTSIGSYDVVATR